MPLFPRYKGPSLLEQICSVENLTQAWRRVRSNIRVARRGRSAGPDAVTLRDFEADWSHQMAQLAEELQCGAYRPLPPRLVQIPKSNGGARAIAILAVRDRVAQRAVLQVLEPLFEPYFLDCSYGCRPLVGVPEAIARVERSAAQGLTWVVDADIACYFDRLDQRILMGLLRQRIDEVPLLQLIAQWLAAGSLATGAGDGGAGKASLLEPLRRGGQAIWRLLDGDGDQAIPATSAEGLGDPYLAASLDAGLPIDRGAAPGWSHRPGLEQRVWTAIALARPVWRGARCALPYAQQFGGHKVMLAGVVAATAAAGGLALQQRYTRQRGTPQGGALSPLLANIYLHPFDVAMTAHGLRLVRFVDDFVIMCPTRYDAEQALQLAQRQLAVLRLELNADKTRIAAYEDGLQFLGRALAPRRVKAWLGTGINSFNEAEAALQRAAGGIKSRMRRRES